MVVALSSSLYLQMSRTEAPFLQSRASNKMSAHVVDKMRAKMGCGRSMGTSNLIVVALSIQQLVHRKTVNSFRIVANCIQAPVRYNCSDTSIYRGGLRGTRQGLATPKGSETIRNRVDGFRNHHESC